MVQIMSIPDNKVINLPVADHRVHVFTEDLHAFVAERGDALPLAIVIGALEIVKTAIITAALDE